MSNYNEVNNIKVELFGLIYELCPNNINSHAQLIDKNISMLLRMLRE